VVPAESDGEAVVLERRDKGFALELRLADNVVDAGQPIDMAAVLTWEGPADEATVWGSGSGPVVFGLRQLDGDLAMEAAQTADCGSSVFARGAPAMIPFRKSGGWSADDPNAEFYRTFFADPVLRLPAGTWRATVSASGYLAPCDMAAPSMSIILEADIVVR
jgi:hypothetical protein